MRSFIRDLVIEGILPQPAILVAYRVAHGPAPTISARCSSRKDAAIYIIFSVGKANISRQALIEAIATLEARREPAGEDNSRAIDTALLALREKLATLQAEPGGPQRHQLVVLVADLSGFTALSEHMDAERVHDAINAMWEVLDGVILAWGGQIDQHAGDSLMALFGLPRSCLLYTSPSPRD